MSHRDDRNGLQLHHVGRPIKGTDFEILCRNSQRPKHRSVGLTVYPQRPKRETSADNAMVRQSLCLQHSQKQLPMPAAQFSTLRRAQTWYKQHVAGGIVAEEHALAAVEGEKMGVPATQGS